MKFYKHFIIAAFSLFNASYAFASSSQEIGSVDTEFKMVGANHKIVIEVFDDPLVQGVSCYVSRAKTGGLKGTFGLAEDPSDASVACRQVGPIEFKGAIPMQAEVFSQSASILFKKIRIVRAVDPKRQTLVYLVYGDKLIEGSPKNSITAVPVGKPIPVK
jgi:CreA protein